MKKWLLPFLVSGCMVGPDYSLPEIQVSEEWSSDVKAEAPEVITEWWEAFEDPLLNQYISSAKEHNFDLLAAEANVLQARALKQVSASALFPHLNASFIPMRLDFSKTGPFFTGISGLGGLSPFNRVFNLFSAFFDASWELDLFGKTRRAIEQANAMIDSAIEQKNDLLISIYAEVARDYIELRNMQTQFELTESLISLYEENAAIIRKNFEAGYSNRYDVEKIEAQLESEKALLPEMIAEIYRSIYSLSILTGQMPEALVDELIQVKPLPKAPLEIAVGLRSDLLRRRPDVRRAERDLAAATANIGVAVSSFFPSITLFGLGGFQSLKMNELFDWKSKTWVYGADFSMPIFQGGKIVGNLRVAQAQQAAVAFAYHQIVLQAIQEAEGSLISYKQQGIKVADLQRALSHQRAAEKIAAEQFHKGLINKTQFLKSQMELIEAELTALSADAALLLSITSLYKSLGGGWEL